MSEYSTIAAFFPTWASAESAVDALEAAGFRRRQIGVAAAGTSAEEQAPYSTASPAYAVGHQTGTTWNKVKNFFSGNTAEPYAGEANKDTSDDNVIMPETYDSEDLHGSLSGLSIGDERRRYFGHRLGSSSGGAIVTVDAEGRESEASTVLEEHGGDLGVDTSAYDYGTTDSASGARNIQLYGEVLRVHKDRVNRGEVRIRKEVHTTTQEIEVPVVREELVVERVPVAGDVPARGAAFTNDEVRVPLSEERVTVTKEPVVREEVRVGKRAVSNVETFDEQVRHEELDVQGGAHNVRDKAV
jgi:uncharacterized protein (TIGR02271 family)